MSGLWWVNPQHLCREKPFEDAVRVREAPDRDERCQRCNHRLADHHWNGGLGTRCCYEVDRFELCDCQKFQKKGKS